MRSVRPASDEAAVDRAREVRGVLGHQDLGLSLRLSPRKKGFDRGKKNQSSMRSTPKASEPMPSTKVPPMPEQHGVAVVHVVHVDRRLDEGVGQHQRAEQREEELVEEVVGRA